ncbi:MAG: preprotein translocase subunit SecE [Thermoleophilaceae bacterium]|nr:preprotein translocase subunit SecE [Thermoleophilaceae bacterium]
MARDRQRAKKRQAKQKAKGGAAPGIIPAKVNVESGIDESQSTVSPAQATGKSTKPPKAAPAAAKAPRERGRFVAFLRSCVAELKRVQWPNRQQVGTLTGIVIGFVIIAGTYLGVIDVVAKKVVDLIIF